MNKRLPIKIVRLLHNAPGDGKDSADAKVRRFFGRHFAWRPYRSYILHSSTFVKKCRFFFVFKNLILGIDHMSKVKTQNLVRYFYCREPLAKLQPKTTLIQQRVTSQPLKNSPVHWCTKRT